MQDEENLAIVFHNVLQAVEKYSKLKADMRKQAKTEVRQSAKEQ